uniref:Uncharacterized protein n=1 Tax=Tetradesmus obliquus TaxID=3088 RepID=A0A383V5E2_TETOB
MLPAVPRQALLRHSRLRGAVTPRAAAAAAAASEPGRVQVWLQQALLPLRQMPNLLLPAGKRHTTLGSSSSSSSSRMAAVAPCGSSSSSSSSSSIPTVQAPCHPCS